MNPYRCPVLWPSVHTLVSKNQYPGQRAAGYSGRLPADTQVLPGKYADRSRRQYGPDIAMHDARNDARAKHAAKMFNNLHKGAMTAFFRPTLSLFIFIHL